MGVEGIPDEDNPPVRQLAEGERVPDPTPEELQRMVKESQTFPE